ncbi:polyketide synthase [Amycolatopsis anabasis]|uniref:polyketide synthase n=1 Tax=Amycolatopsis anabasis TaxID=1840409 RepID=UPI00131B1BC3|nr:polyketide synthase [Amycolatopsis anabasis]
MSASAGAAAGGCVATEVLDGGILLVRMRDEVSRNGFTPGLVGGLAEAFTRAGTDESSRCVVLTGFGNYFATGGTQEDLLAIQEGKAAFTSVNGAPSDTNLYSLPLDCPIPVVAAMQGHAVGGGLAFGLASDFVVLAEEGIYTASFMKYGFTPGFGSTAVFPDRLGFALGYELLMSARSVRGRELRDRGVPFPVVPRAQVLDRALALARELADKPRLALVTLKDHMVRDLRARMPETVRRELAMHDITFHQPEVRERILGRFA